MDRRALINPFLFLILFRIQLAKEEKERIEQAKIALAAKIVKDIQEQEVRTGLLSASCQKIEGKIKDFNINYFY